MAAYNLPKDEADMAAYRRDELPDCPTCGYEFPLEPAVVYDPETGEVTERELFCMQCKNRWTSRPDEETVQPGLARWSM